MAVTALAESPLFLSSTPGPYRLADYLALPDQPRCELIYGRFYVTASPTPSHQLVASLVWQALYAIAKKGGGIALAAPLDVVLNDHTVVQPDISYFTAARRKIIGRRVEGAPDLVVEILSPRTARTDRGEKMKLYFAAGTREYWLVDLAQRQIEFLVRRDEEFGVILTVGSVYRSRVLPEIELDMEALWREVESQQLGSA
ncbi:MAG TPA: Uma2 family endonuclease [Thermoanaerobaculia bacterium]